MKSIFRTLLHFLLIFASYLSYSQSVTLNYTGRTSFCVTGGAGTAATIQIPFTVSGGAFNSGPPPNYFTAELSDGAGSFASPINMGTLIATNSATLVANLPNNITPSLGYKIRLTASNPIAISTNTVNFSIYDASTPPGTAGAIGNNEWIASVYDGGSLISNPAATTYRGFYKQGDATNISFNSWDMWNQNNAPSDPATYQGCSVGNDQHSVWYRRTGFPCKVYSLDIRHDDDFELWVDGVKVAFSGSWDNGNWKNNLWKGLLGPTSRVELKWQEGGGGSYGAIRFNETVLVSNQNISVIPTCTLILAVDADVSVSGMTFTWKDPSNNIVGTGATVTLPGSSYVAGAYTLVAAGSNAGCIRNETINVAFSTGITYTVSPSTSVCAGTDVTLTASGGINYTWKQGATTLGTSASIVVTPTTTTTYSLIANDGCAITTQNILITVLAPPAYNPATDFGTNQWLAFCYDINTTNGVYYYKGYYTEPNLSFDSENRWNNASTPSNANNGGTPGNEYQGVCTVGADNHSVSYKRRGFPCGYYQINVAKHDDNARLFVNGVQVGTSNGYSYTLTAANTSIWRGFLGTTSTVEFSWVEGGGGSVGALDLIKLADNTIAFTSPDVTVCNNGSVSTTLAASLPVSSYAATPLSNITWTLLSGTFTLSATTGSPITATATGGTSGVVRATATDPATGCTIYKDINLTIDVPATNILTSANTVSCPYDKVTLTASGANTYTWYEGTAIPANQIGTGYTIDVYPTTTTSYTVRGSNNCITADASAAITVTLPPLAKTNTDWGTDEWLVLCYNGDLYNNGIFSNTNLTGAKLRGYYTEKSQSFDSRNRWNDNTTPSDAPSRSDGSLAYTGCPVDNDFHSVSYRRKGFPCGRYTISVPYHDDDMRIVINGTIYNLTGCCYSSLNYIPSVLLDENSTVEILWRDGNGASSGAVSIGFTLGGSGVSIWTGKGGDNDWDNVFNWCPAKPTTTISAIIPSAGVPIMPLIQKTGMVCKDLTIDPGATVTFQSGFNLEIYGNLDNSGVITMPTNSTILFKGNTNTTLTQTGTGNFNNFTLDKGASTNSLTLLNNVSINNNLVLTTGELNLGTSSLSINNTATTAISYTANSYIKSENNVATYPNPSKVCWTLGGAGTYRYPFGVAPGANNFIPVIFQKNTATATTVCLSTRGTAQDNLPVTAGTNTNGYLGATATDVIDRWWDISSSVNPLDGTGADVTLSYLASENTLPSPTVDVAIQHFDYSRPNWDVPYSNSSPGVTTGVGTVTGVQLKKFSPHVIATKLNPLPVKLISLKAKAISSFVSVDWITTSENDAQKFIVERSADARSFVGIAEVPANMLVTTQNKAYQWLDKSPLKGTSYYRITLVGTDRSIARSEIVSVFMGENPPANGTLLFIPNPATPETVNLLLTTQEPNTEFQLFLSDVWGREIIQKTIITDGSGEYQEKISQKLAIGVYFAKAVSELNVYRQKLVVE